MPLNLSKQVQLILFVQEITLYATKFIITSSINLFVQEIQKLEKLCPVEFVSVHRVQGEGTGICRTLLTMSFLAVKSIVLGSFQHHWSPGSVPATYIVCVVLLVTSWQRLVPHISTQVL